MVCTLAFRITFPDRLWHICTASADGGGVLCVAEKMQVMGQNLFSWHVTARIVACPQIKPVFGGLPCAWLERPMVLEYRKGPRIHVPPHPDPMAVLY